MFNAIMYILLFLIVAALCLVLFSPIVLLACLLIHAVCIFYNYLAVQYISQHVNELARVILYPAYQTYDKIAIPTGYSTDGWYKREYFRYRYIPKVTKRKAKVYFRDKRILLVVFKEKSPVYQKIMAQGAISACKEDE